MPRSSIIEDLYKRMEDDMNRGRDFMELIRDGDIDPPPAASLGPPSEPRKRRAREMYIYIPRSVRHFDFQVSVDPCGNGHMAKLPDKLHIFTQDGMRRTGCRIEVPSVKYEGIFLIKRSEDGEFVCFHENEPTMPHPVAHCDEPANGCIVVCPREIVAELDRRARMRGDTRGLRPRQRLGLSH